jgi:prophage antirepressor-like protein
MEQTQVVRQEAFGDLQLQILEQDGEEWFSAEDIGKALGMAEPRPSVIRLFNRNREEFEGLYRVVSLTTWLKTGGQRPYRFTTFNPQGAYLLAILARTEKSKALRRWLAKFMAHDLDRLRTQVTEMQSVILDLAANECIARDKIGNLTRELKRARKLASPPRALPVPPSLPLPAITHSVQVDFKELQNLFDFAKAHSYASLPGDYLHQVLKRDEALPRFKLEVTAPGLSHGVPVLTLAGTVAANLF